MVGVIHAHAIAKVEQQCVKLCQQTQHDYLIAVSSGDVQVSYFASNESVADPGRRLRC